jgi:hypothetical protein
MRDAVNKGYFRQTLNGEQVRALQFNCAFVAFALSFLKILDSVVEKEFFDPPTKDAGKIPPRKLVV